ncbi:TIGR03620 family F420-dependent LLM class oxidoreductase [Ilumatobacter sp.]|jgi:probable F420-dependent oxidoreductase|uniref:TIGR03620 family F420-dependent LLM class oxidoreductase n=1 Tax=Ilumatobacter sp. TaxID=1967498 RepID=UPI0030B43EB2|tara:strand:+ start:409 stop:1311 length:903 start_codon:yes stop_codon:yes gene_type:complete
MTTATSTTARDRLSTTGVWYFTDGMSSGEAAEAAGRIESLGYSTLWLPDTVGRDPFAHIAWLASQTTTLQYATGIANIFHRHPGPMKQVANTLAEQTGGRFVLGLGVSHGPMVAGLRGLDYSKPLTKMRDYLAAMETQPYRGIAPEDEPLVLLAALGPKMLELSASAADGAHPYWTTPEHTAMAREVLGPDALLCVEQKVVFTTDADAARAAGNQQIDRYAALPNYRNNWIRLGFSDDEIEQRDHRFVDAVVVWGDEDRVRAGVQAHYDAGADHVCVQPVNPDMSADIDWNALELLAPTD